MNEAPQPTSRFKPGDRVCLSPEGRTIASFPPGDPKWSRRGTIQGFRRRNRGPHRGQTTPSVLWDGLRSPQNWHEDFLALAPAEPAA